MKTQAPNIVPQVSPLEKLDEAKLKLKNAHTSHLKAYVDRKEASLLRKVKNVLGVKTEPPLKIKALADLRSEAKYSRNGQELTPPVPTCSYAAAKAYLALKEFEVNPYPGQPLPRRTDSGSSSQSDSASSKKSVQWAEQLTEVRILD